MLRRTGKKACESASDDKDDSAAHSTALSPKTPARRFDRSFDVLNQHARLPHQRPQLPAFLDGFARIEAVLQRVLIAARSARSRRAPVHAATLFSAHRRRLARPARTRFGPTTQTRQHRAGITRVIAGHFLDGAGQEPVRALVRQ